MTTEPTTVPDSAADASTEHDVATPDLSVRSVGVRTSRAPAPVLLHPRETAGVALDRVRVGLDVAGPDTARSDAARSGTAGPDAARALHTLPVVDAERRLVGVVGLSDLLAAGPEAPVAGLQRSSRCARAGEDATVAARRCTDHRLLALPVVDDDDRLVGMLTVEDALALLEEAERAGEAEGAAQAEHAHGAAGAEDAGPEVVGVEDRTRDDGSEPARRPYLATPVRTLVRSRVAWLLVLAVGATLTVQVLDVFEATLEQQVVLSLFVPLLIGTGGNTGNQAATTVTRALALGDVRPRDAVGVVVREARVGATLGLLLGTVGAVVAALVYEPAIGLVIGLTLLGVCSLAATVGGVMPLVGAAVGVDPAVFSNPFISTFVDASGLVVYFVVARAVLGL